ncbi:MAG: AEC family transporter [Burkholderiaceae bacterium]|jgi:malonate transporter and related proteins|nr:AEC family transporter [Burkholderiaceae bacterium]MDO7649360.1 AEC family transporter [Burkholderiaceae bacterium]MDO7718070.1 AEC family transporter [Burkholderiaceae bacterium]MDO7739465.1 AEC family transporter [Burkholderiaceae bacterium]MDP4696950.1 AEC family transporter [Burkholderiaceae bacterium]
MVNILLVTFPFFALVLAGYIALYRGWLSVAAVPGLNGFVLYFAVPCMLYRFGASTPVADMLSPVIIGVYAASALIMVALTIVITKRGAIGWNDASLGALVAAFPNTGFMGVPLLAMLLGAASAGPAIATILVDMLLTTSLCVALSRLDGAGIDGAKRAAKQALGRVMGNPMPWAILMGAFASGFDIKLWGPIDQTVALLADAASPVALFTIGAVLARSQMQSAHPMPLSHYMPAAVLKLIVHPLLVLGGGLLAQVAGLPLDPFALTCIVLVAALPSASNVSLLAERFGADNGRIARIILVTTVAAFLTFSAAVAFMT